MINEGTLFATNSPRVSRFDRVNSQESHKQMNSQRGFSLIELLIVVAIIAILTTMAIPALVRARIGSNEGSAVSSIKAIITANQTYETRFRSYAGTLADLGDLDLIDEVVAAATVPPGKSCYVFTYTGSQNRFEINADPAEQDSSGFRRFFSDHTGVIRFREGAQATSGDSPID